MFSKTTYTERRKILSKKIDKGLLIFLGNKESPMNYKDNTYHFRQDSNFLYYFGLDQANLAATIDTESGETIIYGNELEIDDIIWTGPMPTIKSLAEKVGVSMTLPISKLSENIKSARASGRSLHYLPQYRGHNKIALAGMLGSDQNEMTKGFSKEMVDAVIQQRSYKSAEEIGQMEVAVNTTRELHIAAMTMAQEGMMEAELAGLVQGKAVAAGGNLAYPVILTVNGQTLHNHHHHNILKKGQLVLGDFGAETPMHYAGDITRTFPVDRQFTNKQKDIYNIVLDAEVTAINACKPGISYKDVHLLAAARITAGLKAIGLMKGDTAEAVAAGAHALFFPHGLGHMIGLDVHDMEDLGENLVGYNNDITRSTQFGLNALRLGRKLEEGFVITVEPGIYFIPELIDRWKAEGRFKEFLNYDAIEDYKDFSGIRIEDDVLITANGAKILGDPIPKTIEEVEAIRQIGIG